MSRELQIRSIQNSSKIEPLAPKLIFPQSGKIEECERETGLRHRSMKFGEDQMVRVHTCDGMYTHLCGRDKHASSHAKRMRGAWWPRTVHERVTPTERTLAD